jgi:hypothetical protein
VAEVGRKVPNTIAKAPITFAMIELADSADCNARKRMWLSYGFKDVTPLFAGQSTVPSLNDSMVPQGRKMLQAMADVAADWYMVSGHHGALYSSDYNLYTTDNQLLHDHPSSVDPIRTANEEGYCGFFNEAYHEGRWKCATRSDPESGVMWAKGTPVDIDRLHANEIYLRTTDEAPNSIAKHTQTNPLLDRTSRAAAPKGIILSACNALIYKSARTTWSRYFPNAVIIGPFSRIASGTWVSNAVASAAMTNESFWRDPQKILNQSGMCEQLSRQLQLGFGRKARIALVYKGNVYVMGEGAPVANSVSLQKRHGQWEVAMSP